MANPTHRSLVRPALAVTGPVSMAFVATGAHAHVGHEAGSGVGAGFMHPLVGADHVVAMVAVGLWAVMIGGRALWALPVACLAAMVAGAAVALAGIAWPAIETALAISAIVLGATVAFSLRPSLAVAAVVVAAFGAVHGHAHGSEWPPGSDAVAWTVGFAAATLLLHAAGLAIALVARAAGARLAVRGIGAAIAAVGASGLLALG